MVERARKRDQKIQDKRDAKKKELKKQAYKKGGKRNMSKWDALDLNFPQALAIHKCQIVAAK